MSAHPTTATTQNLAVVADLTKRTDDLQRARLDVVYRRRDRVFSWLMGVQWVAAILLALWISPWGWQGKLRTPHVHLFYAIILGGLICTPVWILARLRPGSALTRHVVAVSQMLWSAMFIHLTGGRIETHFHVFGSLAFLAFYRDWTVIPTATVVVAADHLLRGLLWPESVYGINNPEWWRFLEHAFWVVFEDIVLVLGIVEGRSEMRTIAHKQAEIEAVNNGVEMLVLERTRELETSREQYRSLVETADVVPWEYDATSRRFTYVGPQAERLLGFPQSDWFADHFWEEHLHPEDRQRVLATSQANAGGGRADLEYRMIGKDGRVVFVRAVGGISRTEGGRNGDVWRGILLDMTERRQLEANLAQAQKLESVGRLAAGVAHEINTPVQFVNDSIHFVRDGVRDMAGVLGLYQGLRRSPPAPERLPEALQEIAAAEEAADLGYVTENLEPAIDRSIEGLDRLATIVRSMKEFAHPDQKEKVASDLNRNLENTLVIARNEYKFVAEVVTDLGELPLVPCYPGELNQVFLNLIVNAAHAIGDVVGSSGDKGRIEVRSRCEQEQVVITISDTGAGIPETIRDKVFDPFFTTKEVGKGSGQGLAIARSVVVDKHQGSLTFTTAAGRGTTFAIRLPLAVADAAGPSAASPARNVVSLTQQR